MQTTKDADFFILWWCQHDIHQDLGRRQLGAEELAILLVHSVFPSLHIHFMALFRYSDYNKFKSF